MLVCDEYYVPKTLPEALRRMTAEGGRARLVAGATDVLPWAREGRAGDVHIPVLIDISGIPDLKERRVANGIVRLGAATPLQRFLDDADLRGNMPGMPGCAIWFADDQIRESATIGGNIVNASPAADALPPLLTANASVEVARLDDGGLSRRRLPLSEFVEGPGRSVLGRDEILIAIETEALPGYGGAFEKVGHRRSLVISVACLSVLVKLDASGGRFEDVRLAIGGVGPVPCRMNDVEAALKGETVTPSVLAAAARLGIDYVQSRSRVEYRRAVVPRLIVRAITSAVQDAGADAEMTQTLKESFDA